MQTSYWTSNVELDVHPLTLQPDPCGVKFLVASQFTALPSNKGKISGAIFGVFFLAYHVKCDCSSLNVYSLSPS